MPGMSPDDSSPNFFISRYLKHQTKDKKLHDPKVHENMSRNLRKSMGLGLNGELSVTSALSDFEKNRITKAIQFKEPTVKDEPLGKVLEKRDGTTTDIENKLDAIFTDKATEYTDEVEKFNKVIDSLNLRLKQPVPDMDPAVVADLLQQQKVSMLAAMDVQFKKENDALDVLAKNDPAFKQDVMNKFDLKEDEYEPFMTKLQETTKARQQEELNTFKNAMNKQISQLYTQAQAERSRIAYISYLASANPPVKNFIEQKVGRGNYANDQSALLSIKLDTLADAGLLCAMSGRKINYNSETNSFEYKFPSKWNIGYNFSRENMAANDMRSIIEAVKSTGSEKIILTLDHPNAKNAEEMSRMAYEQARKAGYPADKIEIRIGGVDAKTGKKNASKQNINQLFDKHPKWKKRIEEDAGKLDLDRKPTLDMKQEVQKLKSELEAQPPAPSPSHNASPT